MIQKSVDVWASMNRTTLHQYRMELINHMEGVLAENLTQKYGAGRGIVMVAGNADTLTRVKWSLQMLRSYGSTLPVQVVSCLSSLYHSADQSSGISPMSGLGRTTRCAWNCESSERNSSKRSDSTGVRTPGSPTTSRQLP